MSYYPKPGNHIRSKITVKLDLSNYAIKQELGQAAGVHTSDLAAKKILML